MTTRRIGGTYYDIICDDEGLLKSDFVVTAIDKQYHPALVGNLFIVRGNNETGEFESLTETDMREILFKSVIQQLDFTLPTMMRDILVLNE